MAILITASHQRHRAVTVALFLVFVAGSHADAQVAVDSTGRAIAWQVQRTGSPGVIRGTVFSASGEAINGAQVTVEHLGIGALTDANGRFELRLPRGGRWELKILYIGYRIAADTITVPEDLGVYLTAVLREATSDLCGLVICGGTDCKDLNIIVLDSVTGAVPSVRVTLRVQHRDGVWRRDLDLDSQTPPYGHVGLGRPITSSGLHILELTAPGYKPWRLEGVELSLSTACHPVLRNRDHTARLVPIKRN